MGQYDTARAVLQQLLDLKPNLPAYSRTSYVRELEGDLVGAEQAMRQALTAGASNTSDVAAVTTFLGDMAFRSGDLAAADREYRSALRLDPGQGGATFGRAQVLVARGRTERAISVLRDLTARTPLLPAFVLLGELETEVGRPAAAARSFGRFRSRIALERKVGANTNLEIAVFEAEHGSPARSLAAARAAYAALPDNIHMADAMAWALLKTGDARAAQPFMVRAMRTGSAEAPMHYHAAVIADALGDSETARRELATVIARNPFFSFSQRDEARALASRLGVPAPRAWSE
jgi:predicted Zn-dependent protease